MHCMRIWCLAPVHSAEELAKELTELRWTFCISFYALGHDGYVFLNDFTHEDEAAKYVPCKRVGQNRYLQVESTTYSWCSYEPPVEFTRCVP